MSEGSESGSSDKLRKFFLGGLNYNTTEDGLTEHFSKFGEIVDVVVIRFPDTKRSRGFGFVTFGQESEANACYEARPHTIEGTEVEIKWATPRDEMAKSGRGDREDRREGGRGGSNKKETETLRKVFVGGLSYSTTSEGLRKHFEQYGELVDCVVLRFHDTKRSRGFGFVTYATLEEVDKCQAARPHSVDGTKVETKRATPKDEAGSGDNGESVTKIFIGGIKDNMTDDDFEDYFSQFGKVTNVEQMMDKTTNRKRGFGFVEFEDYDAVDKVVLQNRHSLHGFRIDCKKALSKSILRESGRSDRGFGGGGRSDRRHDGGGGGGGGSRYGRRDQERGDWGGGGGRRDYRDTGAPSPWGSSSGGGGYGFNSGFGNFGSLGNQGVGGNFGAVSNNGYGVGGGNSAQWGGGNAASPWANDESAGPAWEDQGSWGNVGSFSSPGGNSYGGQGNFGMGGGGGPIRNQMESGRPGPYSYGAGGGRSSRGRW